MVFQCNTCILICLSLFLKCLNITQLSLTMASLKGLINKVLCTQVQRTFMLHFLIISQHNISSLQCFSGQQKDAEKCCLRSFYSCSASTLLYTTVFCCVILWKCQQGKGLTSQLDYFTFQNIMILFWIILSFIQSVLPPF